LASGEVLVTLTISKRSSERLDYSCFRCGDEERSIDYD
jgi:hypothetical protein